MPEASPPLWHATLLGGARVQGPLGGVERLRTRVAFVLLAYLVLHRDRVHPREELVDRFWPEDDPEAARGKLRLALHSIRAALGDLLATDRQTVRVAAPGSVETDRDAFRRLVGCREVPDRLARLERAVWLYRGPFLPGFYDDWALAERERLETEFGGALRELARLYADAGRPADALEAAYRLVALEPYDETAHLLVLRALGAMGRPEATARAVEWARERLAEVGARPGPEIEAFSRDDPLADEEREPAFLGRDADLARLLERLASGLVTVWGPPGVGKTRLAREALRARRGRTAFVSAVGVEGLDEFRGLVRAALGAAGGETLEEAAEAAPGTVVAVDNFESLPREAAGLLARLRASNPTLVFLVTSQRRLGLAEESVLALEPLDVPAEGASVAQIAGSDSVRLLRERVRERGRRLRVDAGNAAAFGTLCRRLEGLPLALELAAEWLDALGPADVVARLDESGRQLAARFPGREARHASLETAVGASLGRLSPELRRALADLSVFVGGCDAEAARAVLDVADPVAALAELEGRALVKAVPDGDAARYEMLDSIRTHVRATTDPAPREAALRRHAAHYAGVAYAMREGLDEIAPRFWADAGNLRLAAERMLQDEPDAERAGETIIGFVRFWDRRGDWALAEASLRRALARLPSEPSRLQASLYNWIGIVGHATNDLVLAEWGFGRRRDTFAALGDAHAVAFAAGNLALVRSNRGDFAGAVPLLRGYHAAVVEKDLSLVGQGRLYADQNLGDALLAAGEDEEGFAYLQEALRRSVEAESLGMVALCCATLGWNLRLRDRAGEGLPYLRRSVEIAAQIGEVHDEIKGHAWLAILAMERGSPSEALAELREANRLMERVNAPGLCAVLAEAGATVAEAARPALAARLLAAQKVWARRSPALSPLHVGRLREAKGRVRRSLGEQAFAQESLRGETMARTEVLAAVREAASDVGANPPPEA